MNITHDYYNGSIMIWLDEEATEKLRFIINNNPRFADDPCDALEELIEKEYVRLGGKKR